MATRAKDSDRDDACRILDQALQDGQLSMTEHQDRISAATRAVTLGDLHELIADLQTENAPVQLAPVQPPLRSQARALLGARAILLAVAIGVPLLGVGIALSAVHKTSSVLSHFVPGASDPGALPDGVAPAVLTPPRQLHSLGGLTGLLDLARQKFGDTLGYRLVVYPDYAVLERPDPQEGRRVLSYNYRGGWGDPTGSAKGAVTADPVDLSRFDPKATVGILRGAPETLGIKPGDVKSTYLIVGPARNPVVPGSLSLSVYVSSDYGSGYIQFDGDGTVTRVNYPS